MSLIELCEIDFYIDGELGPDEASVVEERLESDSQVLALFDAAWRQNETLSWALEALDMPSSVIRHTAELQIKLAQALSRRITQAHDLQPERAMLKPT
jgi:anti-sigma factor RsiW